MYHYVPTYCKGIKYQISCLQYLKITCHLQDLQLFYLGLAFPRGFGRVLTPKIRDAISKTCQPG